MINENAHFLLQTTEKPSVEIWLMSWRFGIAARLIDPIICHVMSVLNVNYFSMLEIMSQGIQEHENVVTKKKNQPFSIQESLPS